VIRGRAAKFTAAAALSVVALTGCSQLRPGAAAVVGDVKISNSQVDKLATALCSANGGSPTGQIPTKQMRSTAVQVLIESQLNNQFGEQEGATYDVKALNDALEQNDVVINLADEDFQEEFTEIISDYVTGQLMLITLGREALTQDGQTDVLDTVALQAGVTLRAEFEAANPVELDPRYGTFANGTVNLSSGSLSVAVSDVAVNGGKLDDAAWITALPAFQKCG
jgi:hypothetical protein